MKTFNIRYFIGELIIVTAGVLIAFQLSQVKESRQDHELTKPIWRAFMPTCWKTAQTFYTSIQQIAEFQTYLQGIIPFLPGIAGKGYRGTEHVQAYPVHTFHCP